MQHRKRKRKKTFDEIQEEKRKVANFIKSSSTGLVYDERCLKHEGDSEHHTQERPARLTAAFDALKATDLLGMCRYVPSYEVTDDVLALVHGKEHVKAIDATKKQKAKTTFYKYVSTLLWCIAALISGFFACVYAVSRSLATLSSYTAGPRSLHNEPPLSPRFFGVLRH